MAVKKILFTTLALLLTKILTGAAFGQVQITIQENETGVVSYGGSLDNNNRR